MADEHLQFGQWWGHAVASTRVSAEGQLVQMRNVGTRIDIPLDERNLKLQRIGSDLAEAGFNWHGDLQIYDMMALQSARTSVPFLTWPRPRIPGGTAPAEGIVKGVAIRIPMLDETQEPDAVTIRTVDAAPDSRVHWHSPGVIFDWEVSATAGVSVATSGAWVTVGTLASGESFDVYALNLHHPAPTTSSTAWSIQSRTTGVTLDAGPAVDKGAGKVGFPSTAHGFTTGQTVEIVGTTNYDADYTVDATTSANEIVVTATFVGETFGGTEQANLILTVQALSVATTTPSWQKVSIDGAWTPGALRLRVETPADNLFYPVVLAVKRQTTES